MQSTHVLNIVANHIFKTRLHLTPYYDLNNKVKLRLSLTTFINNYVKLAIMFINVTCPIELKIYLSWNNTLL